MTETSNQDTDQHQHDPNTPDPAKEHDKEPNQQAATEARSANWYAKLHPIGKDSPSASSEHQPKKILNLSLFFRIWIAVGIIVVISGIVVFNQLFNYVRPITHQVVEDTLVDTSKLMAATLQSAVETGQIYNTSYQSMLDKAFSSGNHSSASTKANRLSAQPAQSAQAKNIASTKDADTLTTPWYYEKLNSSFRMYVTDAKGMVIYDSLPTANDTRQPNKVYHSGSQIGLNAEGEDYSDWNDVNLTLQGKYGARTTRIDADDGTTSVMYVAQPIYSRDNQQIIGVVSIGKPTATLLPYLDATRERMLTASFIISIITLIMAGLIAWWLRQSMLLVTRYTQSLAQDTKKPYFYLGRELNELTDTIETMKHRLENRAYVTDYVHTLTHELKSPLTAIRASGELLEESDLDSDDRLMLSQTITEQSIKLHSLIDRLLLLAKIEQPTFKLTIQRINLDTLMQTLIDSSELQRQYQHVDIVYRLETQNPPPIILADEFWITQAVQNVVDNALYFAHTHVLISLDIQYFDKRAFAKLSIINNGNTIPDYALSKVFDRYFSLSHQYTNPSVSSAHQKKKGTGLGLTLVKQVVERHEGFVEVHNLSDLDTIPATGVEVCMYLPLVSSTSFDKQ